MEQLSKHVLKRRAEKREKIEQNKLVGQTVTINGRATTIGVGDSQKLVQVRKLSRGVSRWQVVRRRYKDVLR